MTWEPVNPRDVFYAKPEEGNCPGCGCPLTFYEIFACRLRGLKRPVCIGCLANALVALRDHIYPTFQALEQLVLELADRNPEPEPRRKRSA